MAGRQYDAIVVGASFAGLAVARELRAEVLLLDRYDAGAHQTSACGTPLWIVEGLGLKESVIQVHERLVVHTPTRTVIFDAAESPYCTFDCARFCRGLLEQCAPGVRFVRTAVHGLADGAVETALGRFEAPCIVDASGWHRALVGGTSPAAGSTSTLTFGLETEAPVGDAAGHCLPLTGEGIRPAVYFGRLCGQLVQTVLEGRRSLDAALAAYERRVRMHGRGYHILRALQWAVQKMPRRWLGPLAELSVREARSAPRPRTSRSCWSGKWWTARRSCASSTRRSPGVARRRRCRRARREGRPGRGAGRVRDAAAV